jgi:hypothetical protein
MSQTDKGHLSHHILIKTYYTHRQTLPLYRMGISNIAKKGYYTKKTIHLDKRKQMLCLVN